MFRSVSACPLLDGAHTRGTDGLRASSPANCRKTCLSAEQHWARHYGLPCETLTIDGPIPADFPTLPPIHLADLSTWPRRVLSSRHKLDRVSKSLFHREASAAVALSFAGRRLRPCSSRRRDDRPYQLHSQACWMSRHPRLRLIGNHQAHDAVPEFAATVIFWKIHLQPCCYLSGCGARAAQWPAGR